MCQINMNQIFKEVEKSLKLKVHVLQLVLLKHFFNRLLAQRITHEFDCIKLTVFKSYNTLIKTIIVFIYN